MSIDHSISTQTYDKLPSIPQKHYFTIGETSKLCHLKPHVLRYWEHEFKELKNIKRRGNRRYYSREHILIIRQIKNLVYNQKYTITGAKAQLEQEKHQIIFSRSKQIVMEVRKELESLLTFLKSSK